MHLNTRQRILNFLLTNPDDYYTLTEIREPLDLGPWEVVYAVIFLLLFGYIQETTRPPRRRFYGLTERGWREAPALVTAWPHWWRAGTSGPRGDQ
jgi:hypothetical protein